MTPPELEAPATGARLAAAASRSSSEPTSAGSMSMSSPTASCDLCATNARTAADSDAGKAGEATDAIGSTVACSNIGGCIEPGRVRAWEVAATAVCRVKSLLSLDATPHLVRLRCAAGSAIEGRAAGRCNAWVLSAAEEQAAV